MPAAIIEVVKPIWIRLSSKELLQRCTRQATQNSNESFNAIVWELCTKQGFCWLTTVEAGAALAVLKFNNGAKMMAMVLTNMGCRVGIHTLKGLAAEDKERLYFAGKKSAEKEKKSRKRRRRLRKGF